MWQVIEAEIERKAHRILAKQARDGETARKYARRFTKRTGIPSTANPVREPSYWSYDPHFHPVYCIKHSRYIAKVIWRKIQEGNYKPKPAIQFLIEKPTGGHREIMAFSIPDSAVGNVFHRRLTARNKGLFSAYSFAYRPDKNIFEAIIHLNRMMQPSKSYILQYDYSKYFDTISHKYIEEILDKSSFSITKAEKHVIRSFLRHQFLPISSYQTRQWMSRNEGVPQGSSLSLFLSNLAAHELDMELERLNGAFVRFADDAIAIAHSYSDARNIELEFRRHCLKTGVKINFDKSPGIRLLSGRKSDDHRNFFVDKDDGSDLESIDYLDFLGHRISSDRIDLTEKAIKRIKRRISRIIYIHLLLYPRQNPPLPIASSRLGAGFIDWDLVTCLNELRKYIYGGLKDRDLTRFIDDNVKLRYVRGLLAFYPLVSSPKILTSLDGWLVNVLQRALRERNRLIASQGLPGTYIISNKSLISGDWHNSPIPGDPNEKKLPSFVLGWRAARKYYKRFGPSSIEGPSYYSLLSFYS